MQYLSEFFKNNDGDLNWIAIVGGSIAFLIGVLPLVAALWNGFYKIPPGCCGVKYRRQNPHVNRSGDYKGLVFLSHSAIRFAFFGWREWRWNTMADITTENVTVVFDLSSGTQVEIKLSFTFGLIPQAEGYYHPEDIHLVRLIRAKEGGFTETLLDSLTSQLRDAIAARGLNEGDLTSSTLHAILAPLVVGDLVYRGVALRRVNVCSASRTWAEKLSKAGISMPYGELSH